MNGSPRTPEEYLKEPYARVLLPDEETETYAAEILEFPGCIAQGDTLEEAYRNLEEAAKGWIQAALDLDQEIPEPGVNQRYSGRVALRLPRSLHRRAMQVAERDGTSLNQFLVAAIAERVGASDLYERLVRNLEDRWSRTAIQIATSDIVVMVASTEGRLASENINQIQYLSRTANNLRGSIPTVPGYR